MKDLHKVKFYFYIVKELISESCFSTKDMIFEQASAKIPATNLLNFDQETLKRGNTPGIEALETLLNAFKKSIPALSLLQFGFAQEKRAFFCISEVLSSFCQSVTLNKMVYKENLQKFIDDYGIGETKMKCEHLGMGAPGLWHGTPDGRFRGLVDGGETPISHLVTNSPNTSDDEMSTDTSETDGTSVVCEAKLSNVRGENVLPQLVKMAVVSSFTENNLHPTLNPMIPVILISSKEARICLYDAQKDVLMISEVFEWLNDDLCKPGITLIWAMLNHR